jgi:hypothetical protein
MGAAQHGRTGESPAVEQNRTLARPDPKPRDRVREYHHSGCKDWRADQQRGNDQTDFVSRYGPVPATNSRCRSIARVNSDAFRFLAAAALVYIEGVDDQYVDDNVPGSLPQAPAGNSPPQCLQCPHQPSPAQTAQVPFDLDYASVVGFRTLR